MSLALFRSSLKLSRMAFMAWSAIILAYAFLVVFLYNSFKETAGPLILSYMESIPEQMQAAVGTAGMDIASLFPSGVMDIRLWVTTEYLSWVPLALAIYAVFYCGGLVSREAERGTLDMLLAQPLARYSLVLSKAATFLFILIGLSFISWAGTAIGLAIIGAHMNLAYLALAHVIVFLLVLSVSAYSTLFSCLFLDPRKSLAIAGVVTAAMYLLNLMGPSLGAAKWLQKASLFYHLDLLKVLIDGAVNWTGVAVYLLSALVIMGVALAIFQRKDLTY